MQAYMGGIAPTYSVNWKKNSSMAIFLAGCDFNCPNCSQQELGEFKEEHLTNILDIKKEITNNASYVDSVFFTGGEPCLQRQALLAISRHARAASLNVGLMTNGSRPDTIKSLVNENLLDYIVVKIQSSFEEEIFQKATLSKNFFNPTIDIIQSVYETLNIIKKNDRKIDIIFETEIVPGINDDVSIILSIASKIRDFRAIWVLKRFIHDADKPNRKIEGLEPVSNDFMNELKYRIEEKFPDMIVELI